MMKLEQLLRELEKIAAANFDVFTYSIRMVNDRYIFEAKELDEGVVFVAGMDNSLQGAAEQALAHLDSACEAWGYKRR